MEELKKKIEALLFSSGRKMDIEEISRLCNLNPEEARKALSELKKTYEETNSSLMMIDEGNFWKLTVREPFLPLVQKIVTQTELSKTLMETLAVIAFKYPIKQSDLIKIRTNKAYDHLKELEEMGYITRQKHGRTKLIKLTQKFFDYFDLPPDKLKEKFETFEGIAKSIEEKESEIKKMKEKRKKELEEAKKKEEEIKKAMESEEPEIDLIDEKGRKEKLEVYEEPKEEPKTEVFEEKIGELEVIDKLEESEETAEEEQMPEGGLQKPVEEEQMPEEEEEKVQKLVKRILSGEEEKTEKSPEQAFEINRRVEEMLKGKKEEEELEEPTETEEDKEKKEQGKNKKQPKKTPETEEDVTEEEKEEPKETTEEPEEE